MRWILFILSAGLAGAAVGIEVKPGDDVAAAIGKAREVRKEQPEEAIELVFADPGFVDPAKGDFRFKDPAVAAKIRFTSFDFAAAGVRGDAAWKAKAAEVPAGWGKQKVENS